MVKKDYKKFQQNYSEKYLEANTGRSLNLFNNGDAEIGKRSVDPFKFHYVPCLLQYIKCEK